ncbi:MAG: heme-binding protein [Kiritimatiellia bacterium]
MKHAIRILLAATVITLGARWAMAIEEATYTVVKSDKQFELRDYAPHVLAGTLVDAGLEEADNQAFRRFFRHISGDNKSRTKAAMTAIHDSGTWSEKRYNSHRKE